MSQYSFCWDSVGMDIKDLESVGMDPNRSAPFSLEPELSPFKDLQEIGDIWKSSSRWYRLLSPDAPAALHHLKEDFPNIKYQDILRKKKPSMLFVAAGVTDTKVRHSTT